MKQTTQQIFNEAVRLPPVERAELIERIIESFDSEQDNEINKAWATEAERRLALHKSGDDRSLSVEEVFDQIERNNKK